MPRYTKRPVTIDAWQVTAGGGGTETPQWLREPITTGAIFWSGSFYTIQTLEGAMRADIGDWIIKGVNGEFYPCKPDIFEKTYEPEQDSATTTALLLKAMIEENITAGELQIAALKAGATDPVRVAQAVSDFVAGRSTAMVVALGLVSLLAARR